MSIANVGQLFYGIYSYVVIVFLKQNENRIWMGNAIARNRISWNIFCTIVSR